jgi:hypothetical protein
MKIIGIDLDNTLISYKGVFHRAARSQGLIPPECPEDKDAVRDYLRSVDREDDWTRLQGHVYGPGLIDAAPYAGAPECIAAFRRRGWRVVIISHKTKTPYLGPPHDLQASAREWLDARGIVGTGDGQVPRDCVFLEESKAAKANRIATMDCDWFVDDLPEFLSDPAFPLRTRRVLFDPEGRSQPDTRWLRASSWAEINALILETTEPHGTA